MVKSAKPAKPAKSPKPATPAKPAKPPKSPKPAKATSPSAAPPTPPKGPTIAQNGGLTVTAYPGANKVLLAMSLADTAIGDGAKNLAGFAIWCTAPGTPERPLQNRLTFGTKITGPAAPEWTNSDQAPFQKFRWVDYPPVAFDKPFKYRVRALYFKSTGPELVPGPEVTVTVTPTTQTHTKFSVGFTRGYIASQAYADLFKNAPIRPAGAKAPDFNTKPYQPQYQWLGDGARALLFDFLNECKADATAKIDFLAYDLDEPDVIAAICAFGKQKRLRAILDDAQLHTKPGKDGSQPPEIKAAQMIIAAAGAPNVQQGHFARFQHNKVIIKRAHDGTAQKVLFGSMNFSIRGIYVQANNIVVSRDPTLAGLFAQAYDAAWAAKVKAPAFQNNPISSGYKQISNQNTASVPASSIAFAPHKDSSVSLGPMGKSIQAAKSSVLFAVMEPTGQGPVLDTLRAIAAKPTIFSYGTVESNKGLAVQSPDGALGDVTGFAALSKNVPPPFKAETNGGAGMHIHDKFVVVDFNGANPTVFTGSSNLASGGEEANGDNLIMIQDAGIAAMYAIEAVALFDHYHFNQKTQQATAAKPLGLWYPSRPNAGPAWWKAYYDPRQIQMRDRLLFANLPVPPTVKAKKVVGK